MRQPCADKREETRERPLVSLGCTRTATREENGLNKSDLLTITIQNNKNKYSYPYPYPVPSAETAET